MNAEHEPVDLPFTTSPVPDSPAAVFWRNRAMALFDQLPLPAAFCLGDGTILRVNRALAAEWGTLAGPLRGHNALRRLAPRDDSDWADIIEAAGHRRRLHLAVRVSWENPDGVTRYGNTVLDVVTEPPDNQPRIVLILHPDAPAAPAPEPEKPHITDIEAQILAHTAGGASTSQIARALGLSVDGVNYHLRRLSQRWNVRGKPALVARAYTEGVLANGIWPPQPSA